MKNLKHFGSEPSPQRIYLQQGEPEKEYQTSEALEGAKEALGGYAEALGNLKDALLNDAGIKISEAADAGVDFMKEQYEAQWEGPNGIDMIKADLQSMRDTLGNAYQSDEAAILIGMAAEMKDVFDGAMGALNNQYMIGVNAQAQERIADYEAQVASAEQIHEHVSDAADYVGEKYESGKTFAGEVVDDVVEGGKSALRTMGEAELARMEAQKAQSDAMVDLAGKGMSSVANAARKVDEIGVEGMAQADAWFDQRAASASASISAAKADAAEGWNSTLESLKVRGKQARGDEVVAEETGPTEGGEAVEPLTKDLEAQKKHAAVQALESYQGADGGFDIPKGGWRDVNRSLQKALGTEGDLIEFGKTLQVAAGAPDNDGKIGNNSAPAVYDYLSA